MTIHTISRSLQAVLLAAGLILTGCASKQDISGLQRQASTRQRMQAKENQELTAQIARLQSDLGKARADLQQEITATSTPVRSKQADLWVEIENLRVQLATANGHIDTLTQKVNRLETSQNNATITVDELSGTVSRVDNAVTIITGQLGIELPVESASPGAHAVTARQPSSSGQQTPPPVYDSAQALYKNALQAFYAKKYDEALSRWQEFVNTFPKDSLVPNALFWQGECHYQMHDYPRAVLAYQRVIEGYRKSNKYRPALLKQGMSFFKLKKKQPGSLVLEDLIKKYPKSVEARRAKSFLKNN